MCISIVQHSKRKIFSTLIEPLVGLQILKIPFFDSYYVSLCSAKLWVLAVWRRLFVLWPKKNLKVKIMSSAKSYLKLIFRVQCCVQG